MVNALKLMETANNQTMLSDYISAVMEYDIFKDIATRCGFKVIESHNEEKGTIRLKKRSIPYAEIYSRDEDKSFNFLDISDIHVGNEDFDSDKLNEVLQIAKEREVKQVFIAGDIFEAVNDDKEFDFRIMNIQKQKKIQRIFKDQLYTIFNILKHYDFSYYAINGNHEYVYEQLGVIQPLKMLEKKLQSVGINFNAYDTYIVDFGIAGVVKRVIHLESYYEKSNVVCRLSERLNQFNIHGGLTIKNGENLMPIRFLECGHVHLSAEIYDSNLNVFIQQPGSFIKCEENYNPGIFVRGEVTPELNIVRY